MKDILYRPIGIINTPFESTENIPIQNSGGRGVKGTIEIYPEFTTGLMDLEGFSHLILIYHLHKVKHTSLIVKPFMDLEEHGVFATRSPVRPNPIGLTVVKLIGIKANLIFIEDLDMLNNTPLLDIKPCLPMIDDINNVKIGWLTGRLEEFEKKKSDNRFKL
jgi:tRNA-Thr(GGU) m(6)t(6)A37 methyltransferase TsaA